ncbi:MAG: FG-GAP repeat protein [Planctomycetota bacterium]
MIALLPFAVCAGLVAATSAGPPFAAEPAPAEAAAAFRIVPAGEGAAAWRARNPTAGLTAELSPAGVSIAAADEEAGAALELALARWGRGELLAPVATGPAEAAGERLAIRRGRLIEWYANDARGLEQGFTVLQPPLTAETAGRAPLVLELAVGGGRGMEIQPGERAVRFAGPPGRAAILYGGLRAWDATGRELAAWFAPAGDRLRILVADEGAILPVVIDPWVWLEEEKLFGSDLGASHFSGAGVALQGNTALVGAYGDDHAGANAGAVYVFVRSGTSWTQEAKLTASDANGSDYFGAAVALDGDTALIGSKGSDGATANAGAAYVFTRSGTVWTQQAKLTAGDGAPFDELGWRIALSGNTAVAGARYHDHTGFLFQAGAAYVFVRSGTTWSMQAELLASDADWYAQFGTAVAVEDDTALVGAPLSSTAGGGAYVFARAGTSWTEETKLTASDLYFTDWFGGAVDLDGDTALVGSPMHTHAGGPTEAGAVYVYTRAGTSWSEEAELQAQIAGDYDDFGLAVAADGDRALIGAPHRDFAGTYAGGAYVFERAGTSWSEATAIQTNGLEAGDQLGDSVALSGDTALLGVPGDDDAAVNAGAAFVLRRSADAEAVFRNDAGSTNPMGYTATAPEIGANWTAIVDNTGTSNTFAWVVGYPDPLEVYLPLADDYLLVDPSGGELLGLAPAAGSGPVVYNVAVPLDLGLAGIRLSTQGAGFGGVDGVTLHNAYDLFVGQ